MGLIILKCNADPTSRTTREGASSVCYQEQYEAQVYFKCCNEIKPGILILGVRCLWGRHLWKEMNQWIYFTFKRALTRTSSFALGTLVFSSSPVSVSSCSPQMPGDTKAMRQTERINSFKDYCTHKVLWKLPMKGKWKFNTEYSGWTRPKGKLGLCLLNDINHTAALII